jgi:chromosome segregation ATPase
MATAGEGDGQLQALRAQLATVTAERGALEGALSIAAREVKKLQTRAAKVQSTAPPGADRTTVLERSLAAQTARAESLERSLALAQEDAALSRAAGSTSEQALRRRLEDSHAARAEDAARAEEAAARAAAALSAERRGRSTAAEQLAAERARAFAVESALAEAQSELQRLRVELVAAGACAFLAWSGAQPSDASRT